MIAAVADTHTALWYLLRNPLLSTKARQFTDDAAASENDIVISRIEKNRLPSAKTIGDLTERWPELCERHGTRVAGWIVIRNC